MKTVTYDELLKLVWNGYIDLNDQQIDTVEQRLADEIDVYIVPCDGSHTVSLYDDGAVLEVR